MCLILFAYRMHPLYPLVVAANRDEFYERPTAAADFWEASPAILAGRDLRDGGTWLGITREGRFAALTNYRDPLNIKLEAPSRGWLVRDYLLGRQEPDAYLHDLAERADRYNGFSLILGSRNRLYYYSNRDAIRELPAGFYGLSNHLLDTPWPKVEKGKEALKEVLEHSKRPSTEDLFAVLNDRSRPEDGRLPDTGVGIDWERILSSIFIESPNYGTRSSTVLIVGRNGWVSFAERSYNGCPEPWMTARFGFRIGSNRGRSKKL
ncbi:MAG: NRDE family protein [Deltaproteobacteria bacterium]|nr:NRDE family protein [Deltaproteobacteria bacterium]